MDVDVKVMTDNFNTATTTATTDYIGLYPLKK